jgi:hypothetical protein
VWDQERGGWTMWKGTQREEDRSRDKNKKAKNMRKN